MYAGRKETKTRVLSVIRNQSRPFWIHCASLGEFEQGRPVIEALKTSYPDVPLILSFFSSSGYKMRYDFPHADCVVYLPSDTPDNARWIVHDISPQIFIFVKYEFWWNLIHELGGSQVKMMLVSGVFRPDDYFFNSLLKPLKQLVKTFDILFVQDEYSAEVLRTEGIKNCVVSGDTRVDRVLENAGWARIQEKWIVWKKQKKVFIYGSVWDSDMHIVRASVSHFSDSLHVIVPHDISDQNVKKLCQTWEDNVSYWSDDFFNYPIVVVNTIGILNQLYTMADFVYVGGGFQKGIHNILEPASYGIPVFFGPHHQKFTESYQLITCGQGFSIRQFDDMQETVEELIRHPSELLKIREASHHFFQSHSGATRKVMSYIRTLIT